MAGDSDPNGERVQEHSTSRQHERAESVERMLEDTGGLLDETKYPTTSEELAVEYADEMIDLPNETESLGSVFDRLVDERFASPTEAREAIINEVTGEQAGREEYNDERALDDLTETPGEPVDADDRAGAAVDAEETPVDDGRRDADAETTESDDGSTGER